MHRRHVNFSVLVPNTFQSAMFSLASLCQDKDFHFLLLPPKPNTADYKGTGQIPVVPTECVRVELLHFFGRLKLARKLRESF
jgi:hypothetical protein